MVNVATACCVQERQAHKSVAMGPFLLCSANLLALCDFWLFPKGKMSVEGKHLQSIQDMKAQPKTLIREDFTTAPERGKMVKCPVEMKEMAVRLTIILCGGETGPHCGAPAGLELTMEPRWASSPQ